MSEELTQNDKLEVLKSELGTLEKNLPGYTTPALTDLTYGLKSVEKRFKSLLERAKEEIRSRGDEGGQDDKGHRYLVGERGGIKLTKRVTVKLVEDAAQKLTEAGYEDVLPREVDPKLADKLLQKQGVDRKLYTDVKLTGKQLEQLVEQGKIPEDVALDVVADESVSWAVSELDLQDARAVLE